VKTATKRLIIFIVGILAGVTIWPATELLLHIQVLFSSYLTFITVQGILLGAILGAFFGSVEGIFTYDGAKIVKGIIVGLLFGAAGGIVGVTVGQAILFLLGRILFDSYKNFNMVWLPLARAAGWAVMGVFVGMAEGFRARSVKKIGIGILGGFSGGFVGGCLLEYSRLVFTGISYTRLAGLVIFSVFIALFYAIIEKRLSLGVLKLLNGRLRGKEFIINQRKIRLGKSRKNEVQLNEYTEVSDLHARISVKRNEVVIEAVGPESPLYVNDDPVNQKTLKYEDVIKIGSAKFYYQPS
jgi:hypothetical protein